MLKAFSPGTILNTRYEIIAKLGEGGFAVVYKACDKELNRTVALKILKLTESNSVEELARIRREAKSMAQLVHRNIAQVFSFEMLNERIPFLVMEYLEGCPISELLNKTGPLELSIFEEIFDQICDGLGFAHDNGIIHRDISPKNILVSGAPPHQTVKLIDFGLSKRLGADTLKLTGSGCLLGNPPYMSPESCRGEDCDQRSDIYALGCLMYTCLTGSPPFDADTAIGILYLQLNQKPPEPAFTAKDRVKERRIKQVLARCLQKDKSKRFQSCEELRHALKGETTVDESPEEAINDPWLPQLDAEPLPKPKAKFQATVSSPTMRPILILFFLFALVESSFLLLLASKLNAAGLEAKQESQLIKVSEEISGLLDTAMQAFHTLKAVHNEEAPVDVADYNKKCKQKLVSIEMAMQKAGLDASSMSGVKASCEKTMDIAPEVFVPGGLSFNSPAFQKMVVVSFESTLECYNELCRIRQMIAAKKLESTDILPGIDAKTLFFSWVTINVILVIISMALVESRLLGKLRRIRKQNTAPYIINEPVKIRTEIDRIQKCLYDLSKQIAECNSTKEKSIAALKDLKADLDDIARLPVLKVEGDTMESIQNSIDKLFNQSEKPAQEKVLETIAKRNSLKVQLSVVLVCFILLQAATAGYLYLRLSEVKHSTERFASSRESLLSTQEIVGLYGLFRNRFAAVMLFGREADWALCQRYLSTSLQKSEDLRKAVKQNSSLSKAISKVHHSQQKVDKLARYFIEHASSAKPQLLRAIFVRVKSCEDSLESAGMEALNIERNDLVFSFDHTETIRRELILAIILSGIFTVALILTVTAIGYRTASKLKSLVKKANELSSGKTASPSIRDCAELEQLDRQLCELAIAASKLQYNKLRLDSALEQDICPRIKRIIDSTIKESPVSDLGDEFLAKLNSIKAKIQALKPEREPPRSKQEL